MARFERLVSALGGTLRNGEKKLNWMSDWIDFFSLTCGKTFYANWFCSFVAQPDFTAIDTKPSSNINKHAYTQISTFVSCKLWLRITFESYFLYVAQNIFVDHSRKLFDSVLSRKFLASRRSRSTQFWILFCDKNAIKRQYNMRRVKLKPFDTFLSIHRVALSFQNTEAAVDERQFARWYLTE